jgi:hypothetical protein
MTKYIVYSPDNFTIDPNFSHYTSKKNAINAFEKWKERYTQQGYYSSAEYGRIPLDSLQSYCRVEIKKP